MTNSKKETNRLVRNILIGINTFGTNFAYHIIFTLNAMSTSANSDNNHQSDYLNISIALVGLVQLIGIIGDQIAKRKPKYRAKIFFCIFFAGYSLCLLTSIIQFLFFYYRYEMSFWLELLLIDSLVLFINFTQIGSTVYLSIVISDNLEPRYTDAAWGWRQILGSFGYLFAALLTFLVQAKYSNDGEEVNTDLIKIILSFSFIIVFLITSLIWSIVAVRELPLLEPKNVKGHYKPTSFHIIPLLPLLILSYFVICAISPINYFYETLFADNDLLSELSAVVQTLILIALAFIITIFNLNVKKSILVLLIGSTPLLLFFFSFASSSVTIGFLLSCLYSFLNLVAYYLLYIYIAKIFLIHRPKDKEILSLVNSIDEPEEIGNYYNYPGTIFSLLNTVIVLAQFTYTGIYLFNDKIAALSDLNSLGISGVMVVISILCWIPFNRVSVQV